MVCGWPGLFEGQLRMLNGEVITEPFKRSTVLQSNSYGLLTGKTEIV
jgi:hypothetical protein